MVGSTQTQAVMISKNSSNFMVQFELKFVVCKIIYSPAYKRTLYIHLLWEEEVCGPCIWIIGIPLPEPPAARGQ